VTWGYGRPSQIPSWEADWVICQPWDILQRLRLNQGAPNHWPLSTTVPGSR